MVFAEELTIFTKKSLDFPVKIFKFSSKKSIHFLEKIEKLS